MKRSPWTTYYKKRPYLYKIARYMRAIFIYSPRMRAILYGLFYTAYFSSYGLFIRPINELYTFVGILVYLRP